jgi:hypothetical protein
MVNGKFPILTEATKTKRKFETRKEREAYSILDSFSRSIMSEFQKSKNANYDANTKGGNYEKVVSEFLKIYFGGVLDFYVRAQILDINLDCIDLFPKSANSFDVVAAFKTAIPRLVFTIKETAFIPLDSIAFIVEVKDTVTKPFLKKDLEKLKKFSELKFDSGRFGVTVGSEHELDRPLRALIYGSRKISDISLIELMKEYAKYWDILIILDTDQIWKNPSISPLFYCPIRSMYQGIMAIAESLPGTVIVDTTSFFSNLLLIGEP